MREKIEIDISAIRSTLDALPEPHGDNKRVWTQDEDEILLDYWNKKKHKDVARALGVCTDTALWRYRELTR